MMMDVSVVIPTYNRKDALLATLTALGKTQYSPGCWEVIIVDDGSSDDTPETVCAWAEASGAPVRCIQQANAGPAAARNRGAVEAKGRYLIFIDNDILVQPDFVGAHVEALQNHPGCWVIGRITHPPELRATPFGRYRDAVWESFHAAHTSAELIETEGMTAANFCVPRADFLELGGFDTDFTIASSEDWELGFRARRTGIKILYHPGIVVLHNDWAVSLERFCERQRLYSISDVLLCRKYGTGCPRIQLVLQNGPLCWRNDSPGVIGKKLLKKLLAGMLGRACVRFLAQWLERWIPDSFVSRAAYQLAVSLAIFIGVREGFRRYGAPPPTLLSVPNSQAASS